MSSLTWTKDTLPGHSGGQSKVICASRIFTLNELELAGLIDDGQAHYDLVGGGVFYTLVFALYHES